MAERHILFSGPMVLAILNGSKVQTRRVVKPVRGFEHYNICRPEMMSDPFCVWWHGDVTDRVGCSQECPFGKPGHKLWVRETWCPCEWGSWEPWERARKAPKAEHHSAITYRADHFNDNYDGFWRPSIFMPRWASRITLEITGVRVERLQEISESDAKAEGVATFPDDPSLRSAEPTGVMAYRILWDKLNGKRAPWSSNPFVWVVEFKRTFESTKAAA